MNQITVDDLQSAIDTRDSEIVQLLHTICTHEDPPPDSPIREGALTFQKFLVETQSPVFKRKTREEQKLFRTETLDALQSDDAEVPLSTRLKSHEIIYSLWTQPHDIYARSCLLQIIRQVPLVYGPWKALKRIFKEAEENGDTQIYGALAARFDMAFARKSHSVSQATIGYLVRRAWRTLRARGVQFPATYADLAVDYLCEYTDDTWWRTTWIANHIFFHETGKYVRHRFKPSGVSINDVTKHRAFGDLWRRTHRPLFDLLQRARCEHVRNYAVKALKTDFRSTLREVEPEWVARLVRVHSASVDEFVVWLLGNVPRFEQSAFRELGLHDAVLHLFQSDSDNARKFAAQYARTHARDLPVDQLVLLANNSHDAVRKLAVDLLKELDPRKDVGLDGWGRLLSSYHSHKFAAEVLLKHFGKSELTPDWFADRLRSEDSQVIEFVSKNLTKIHPLKTLGVDYFVRLLEDEDVTEYEAQSYLCSQLYEVDPNAIESETLQRLLLNTSVGGSGPQSDILNHVRQGKIAPTRFPVSFLKAIAFHPDFGEHEFIQQIRRTSWGKHVDFDESLSETVFEWLSDVRNFLPNDIGFEWLMRLVQRSEPRYHDFAVRTLTKSFLPADFAAQADDKPKKKSDSKSDDEEINVDLAGASFVFTGKLATMTRSQAQGKVTTANGTNSKSVTKKLDYLVIGDEGSPLYDQGRKGSKQLKAESLIEDGAELRIISETAFLQMLTGQQREFSDDSVQAGCENLWEMLTDDGPEDEPLRQFAVKYIRHHHPEICLKETDRPVDPGAEMPDSFMTFDRLKPLFFDKRTTIRTFALEWASYEFGSWAPPIEGIIELCESPYDDVRAFVAKTMTCDDAHEHKRYRINPDILTPEAVYSFCESKDDGTRALGMELIERHPRLRLPEELFRLTESPDRRVRAFVIRAFWSLYRDRGITGEWKPVPPPTTTVGKKAKKDAEAAAANIGTGAPEKPETRPADDPELQTFLRRVLFEIPPGRFEKTVGPQIESKLRPLPARKSKLLLIDTLRDLAIEDVEFANAVLPLLTEFMASKGKSEMEACLVAVTRIQRTHDIKESQRLRGS